MSHWTTTSSLSEILMPQSIPNLLAIHGLLFKLRESHQLSILSLLGPVNVDGFAQGTYQDIPYQYERPDCWRTHQTSGTKRFSTSLSLYVWQVTYPKQPKWGSVTKIGYFGTYLQYLPTNPMSRLCDNIPANPSWITDVSRYHFRHSTSSSTVELLSFC